MGRVIFKCPKCKKGELTHLFGRLFGRRSFIIKTDYWVCRKCGRLWRVRPEEVKAERAKLRGRKR